MLLQCQWLPSFSFLLSSQFVLSLLFQTAGNVLDNPVEPVSDATYYDCLESATEKSIALSRSMASINQALKKEDRETFRTEIGNASESVCALTESAAQVRS